MGQNQRQDMFHQVYQMLPTGIEVAVYECELVVCFTKGTDECSVHCIKSYCMCRERSVIFISRI